MKLSQPVVVLRHKNKKFARQMAALLKVEGIRCSLEAALVQHRVERRAELRLLVDAADALRAQALIADHRRALDGQLRRPTFQGGPEGRAVQDHRPALPPHQRSALPSYHHAERVKTASRRRGHRAHPGEGPG